VVTINSFVNYKLEGANHGGLAGSSNGLDQWRLALPVKRLFLRLCLDEAGVETRALSINTLKALLDQNKASPLCVMYALYWHV
jgi:hypothetical protein